MPEEGDDLLTTAEVAKRLRVSQDAVQRWVRFDQIRYIRLPGGRLRIPRSEVERLLRQQGPDTDP
jgi:excisionase family DNA binding protein